MSRFGKLVLAGLIGVAAHSVWTEYKLQRSKKRLLAMAELSRLNGNYTWTNNTGTTANVNYTYRWFPEN